MKKIMISLLLVSLSLACQKQETDSTTSDSIAQQVASVTAAIDEGGGSTGSYTFFKTESKSFAKLGKKWIGPSDWDFSLFQKIYASNDCSNTFGACINNVITRNFNSCSVNGYTFSGTITLTFTDAANDSTCSATTNGHTISRDPDFQITGPRNAVFTVQKTGSLGQVLTRGATNFTFTNDGIQRTLTYNGKTLASYTTTTVSGIVVSGNSRIGRTANGGTLRVLNDLNNVSCDFTPSNLTWNSTCNCPVSGSWTTTCSDGKSGSLTINSCTSGTIVLDSSSDTVTFDRCELL
jgi:hypothetical protein